MSGLFDLMTFPGPRSTVLAWTFALSCSQRSWYPAARCATGPRLQVRPGAGAAGRTSPRIPLHADQRTFNKLLRGLRCLGERGFALLVGRWKILRHVKISPSRITDLARAALVLTHFEHNMIA